MNHSYVQVQVLQKARVLLDTKVRPGHCKYRIFYSPTTSHAFRGLVARGVAVRGVEGSGSCITWRPAISMRRAFVIWLARVANLRAIWVSSASVVEGDTQTNIKVFEDPPMASCKSWVSLWFLYGTVTRRRERSRAVKDSMTSPSAVSDLL